MPPISDPESASKQSEQSDDMSALTTNKKHKDKSSTGDNNLIITDYQPDANDMNLILDLVVYDIPAKGVIINSSAN
ncbi:hypothetical protein RclHR1_13540009 [Rhizophagus clarus]|uniref:Uncharacterized protein n=1 Tax=Rhizophagus clarus TaxID=94130 RepID=A0A2Z6QEQ3_9GLOM|nr:hypothetical protein RclHR1_13540009 [Rhizophagus clarus]GES93848.1 hypothetical protein RCL_jg27320.t1 [Rhizophagus clarus]